MARENKATGGRRRLAGAWMLGYTNHRVMKPATTNFTSRLASSSHTFHEAACFSPSQPKSGCSLHNSMLIQSGVSARFCRSVKVRNGFCGASEQLIHIIISDPTASATGSTSLLSTFHCPYLAKTTTRSRCRRRAKGRRYLLKPRPLLLWASRDSSHG